MRRGPGAAAHVGVRVPQIYPHTRVGEYNYPNSSQVTLHQSEQDVLFTSTTATDGVLAQGSFVDIRLPAGACSVITGMTLEVTIRAGSAGVTVMPVPIVHILDRVEFLGQAGNVLISRHEASQLCWPFRHLNESQLQLHQKTFNFWCHPASSEHGPQTTYPATFVQLAAGEERVYYIPLLENPFVTCRVFGGAIAADCFVRCWFKGPSSFFIADPTGSPPSLKSLNLIVSQDALSPSARNELAQRYASQSMDFRFFRPGF